MCLSANEPGGPRRCESYMKNVHAKVVALHSNLENQRTVADRLKRVRANLHRVENLDTQQLSPTDAQRHQDLIQQARNDDAELQNSLNQYKAEESGLRKKASTAKKNHNEEVERRKRMGVVVNNQEEEFDDDEPYMTLSPHNFSRFQSFAAEQEEGIPYRVRTRMMPISNEDGYNPNITVQVKDVQFTDPIDDVAFRRDSDGEAELGGQDKDHWYAQTDNVLNAAMTISNGGRDYISKRHAGDSGEATGDIVRNAVYDKQSTTELTQDDINQVSDFKRYCRQFPGDSAYSQKIKEISAYDYVSHKDAAVLASAVSSYRRYLNTKNQPKLNEQRQRENLASGPTQVRPKGHQKRVPQPDKNDWVGEIGGRMNDQKVKIVHSQKMDSDYGGKSTLLIMKNHEGSTLKWLSSNDLEVRKGDTLSIRGTIKDHEDYQGQRQTTLMQCQYDVLQRANA